MSDAKQPITLRPRRPDVTDEQWRQWVENELQDGASMFNTLSSDIQTNTAVTNQVKADTGELVEFFRNMQGFFKVLNGIGKLAKPIGYILGVVGALVTIWVTWRTGTPPK